MDSELLHQLAQLNDKYLALKEKLSEIEQVINDDNLFDYQAIGKIMKILKTEQ